MSNFLNTAVQQVAWALSPFVVVIALLGSVMAAEEHYVANGYGLSGHDPVAYFTVGQPVEGDSRYVANHNGITYRFSFQKTPKPMSPRMVVFVLLAPQWGGNFRATQPLGKSLMAGFTLI
jgi:hypothetical protein